MSIASATQRISRKPGWRTGMIGSSKTRFVQSVFRSLPVLLCLLYVGCGAGHSDQLAEERRKAKTILTELERVVVKGRVESHGISGELNERLAAAQNIPDNGKTVRNTLANIMVSGEMARASSRMMRIGDTVHEAYAKAKSDIKAMTRKNHISKQTSDWAILEIERLWLEYKDEH